MTDAISVSVVADADTLFGGTTRALLIHLDYEGLIALHWRADILSEMSRALVRSGRRRDTAHACENEVLMRRSLPDAEVHTEDVQRELVRAKDAVHSLKDAHVAACAMALVPRDPGAIVHLLTKNLKDFRRLALQRAGIHLQPDGQEITACQLASCLEA